MKSIYDSMLSIDHTICKDLFMSVDNPWEVLPKIKDAIYDLIKMLDESYIKYENDVYIHKTCKVSKLATIEGPTIIGENTEIRPGAYIRGNAIIGKNCVIGNSTEVKNAIIFDNAQCPHYNYIGDAILGYKAHTGAGVILSNLKSDKSLVKVDINGIKVETGLKKLSAILGDNVEIGCNSVMCPGSVVFENSNIYPLSRFRGTLEANKIYKGEGNIVAKKKLMETNRMFGTDGIRGKYLEDLTLDLAAKVGKATAIVLGKEYDELNVIIGMDTRYSGPHISSAITSGLLSYGVNVLDAGIIPTPAISYLTKELGKTIGIMITASHNPVEYNGIKIFNSEGLKLPDNLEDEIEKLVKENNFIKSKEVGRYHYNPKVKYTYIDYLASCINIEDFDKKVIVDCANGAATITAEKLFSKLGINAKFINTSLQGSDINDKCGSTHLDNLKQQVIINKADVGIAFDGDADRCLMVDSKGNEVSGDQIIAIISNDINSKEIVGTVMSNLGLKKYCKDNNKQFIETKVGDRYILEEILNNNYKIGGEQSGHVILKDYLNTGAGELTALKVLEIMNKTNKSLDELSQVMKVYPQVLKNVETNDKTSYKNDEIFKELINKVETLLNGDGRVLIRPSGTENLIRVMIEGNDIDKINIYAEQLAMYLNNNYGLQKGMSRTRK